MDDAFQTPPRLATMPLIGDVIPISKQTLISLLLDLPIQELFVRSNIINDDDSDRATLNFIHELGRALSTARITTSAPKASPKKRLYGINTRPTESAPQLEAADGPRTPTGLAAGIHGPSSPEPRKPVQGPRKQARYMDSRRQEVLNTANAMRSLAQGNSTHTVNRMLTEIDNLNTTEEPIDQRSILESIKWSEPPRFRRAGPQDPRRRRMIDEVKSSQLHREPFYLTRLARQPSQNHPFVFI
jgi:hypothetical protein